MLREVHYNTNNNCNNNNLNLIKKYVSSRWFWEVFHELSIEDKKKFLLFLTGSDRVPIQGMRDIKVSDIEHI